jgi:hypothetical protein
MSGKVGGQKGSSLSGIPAASRKMVQSLKEIVTNIPDNEIYATLKDCNMDPNEAVSRLLSQGFSLSLFFPLSQSSLGFFNFQFFNLT